MMNYAGGYYDDQAAKPKETGLVPRQYAAIVKRSQPAQENQSRSAFDEDTEGLTESDYRNTRKIIKPRYYTYNMATRTPHAARLPTNTPHFGYLAFKERYGEDSIPQQKIPPRRRRRPEFRREPETLQLSQQQTESYEPQVNEQIEDEGYQENDNIPENLWEVDSDDYLEVDENQELSKVRLLAVTPDPDTPSGPATILEAKDLLALGKIDKTNSSTERNSNIFQDEVTPTDNEFSWL